MARARRVKAILEHDAVTAGGLAALDIDPLIAALTPFWLDIEDPSDDVIDRIGAAFDLHQLAIDDSKQFDQRGKLVRYGDVAMLVGFGLDGATGEPIEVHAYLTEHAIVTMRRRPCDAIDGMHGDGSLRSRLGAEPLAILHHVASALHSAFPTYIDRLELQLAEVESAMVDDPRPEHLAAVTAIRQRADSLRRVLAPGRDVATRATSWESLPGQPSDAGLYARDIADELRHIVGDLAAVGERCILALSLHASLLSNRQAEASRQLAAVATVFLPISFVAAFFGMNFDVLVNDFEQGWPVFILFGVVLNLICVAGTMWWLGRRDLR